VNSKAKLIKEITQDVHEKWKPVLDEEIPDDSLAEIYSKVLGSMKPKWNVDDLVEIWIKSPAIGLIISRSYRTTSMTYVYEVLADGELHERRESKVYDIGKSEQPFSFPKITNPPHQLIPQDIIKVQPMTAPKGNIFYLDYTYGDKDNEQVEPTLTAESSTERIVSAVQEEESGLWGRICGLWSRWRSGSPG